MKLKKILPIILVVFITFAISGCSSSSTTAESKPSWEVSSAVDTIFARNISGFISKKVGITVGFSGEIHYTSKGEKKWLKGNNSTLCLYGLCILNNKIAYACGNGRYVVKTTDGGGNWYKVANFGNDAPNHPRYISFADEKTGWIAKANKFGENNDSILMGSTNDGGQTWNEVKLPEELKEISAIYLRTPKDGYIIDSSGNLYTTVDGGKSFNRQTLGLKDAYLTPKLSPYIALKFSDEKNVFIAYGNQGGTLKAARSTDGGKTWKVEPMPDMPNGALYLSPDGKMLTVTGSDQSVKILEYK